MFKKQSIFLIDGIGALLSAIFLGIVSIGLEEFVGVSIQILYILAIIAILFSAFSLSCHFFFKKKSNFFLYSIAIANLSYCALTIILLTNQPKSITTWGIFYFTAEILIIVTLAIIELKLTKR